MSDEKIRLQKYLALCGIASRRKAEELITQGLVKVNGSVVDKLGSVVNSNDVVEYNGKVCSYSQKQYYVLYKPSGYICSVGDDRGRKTIFDLVDTTDKLFSVGRLDYNSEGLIILTNDGDLANGLIHPSKRVIKEYRVESNGLPSSAMICGFTKGVMINDIRYKAYGIDRTNNRSTLLIRLIEGKKREIREVYKFFGIDIKSLVRIKIGQMSIDRLSIKKGEYIKVSKEELEKLIFGDVE